MVFLKTKTQVLTQKLLGTILVFFLARVPSLVSPDKNRSILFLFDIIFGLIAAS